MNETRPGDPILTQTRVWRLSFPVFCLLLGTLIGAAFFSVLFLGKTFYFRDYGVFAYPMAHYHRECFWQGEWPLWNPYGYCGLPFLAQSNTIALYPGALIYLLLPLPWSLSLFCLMHLALGGIGAYFLCRRWSCSASGAALGGITFAFSGVMLNALMWPSIIATMAWMPWVFATVPAGWRVGGRYWLAAVAAATMQMLAGSLEITLLTWLMLGALCALDLISGKGNRLGQAGRLAGMVVMTAALCAAQLLPFFELLQHSQRTGTFDSGQWPMPWWGWANFILPLFRCHPGHQGVFFQYDQNWLSSYYLGIGAWVLAGVGLWKYADRPARLMAAMTAVFLLAALGPHTPVFAFLLKTVPPLRVMRFPVKFVIPVTLGVALLAALGWTWIERLPETRRPALRRGLWAGGVAVLLLVVGLLGLAKAFPLPYDDWNATWKNGLMRLVFLGLLAGIIGVAKESLAPATRVALMFAMPVVVAVDLFTQIPRHNPLVDNWVYERDLLSTNRNFNPAPAYGRSRAMLRLAEESSLGHLALEDPNQELVSCRMALYLNCNLIENLPTTSGLYPLTLRRVEHLVASFNAATNSELPRLADFLGVAYINAPGKFYEWRPRPGALPFVTAGQRPVFADAKTTVQALADPGFEPLQVVYLPPEATNVATLAKAGDAPIVTGLQVKTHRVEFEVESQEPCLAVIAQAWYPCWKAWVDGQTAPLLRANHAFQAVPIPAGKYRVTVRYQDRAFTSGLVIAGLAFCWWIGVWYRTRPGRQSQNTTDATNIDS